MKYKKNNNCYWNHQKVQEEKGTDVNPFYSQDDYEDVRDPLPPGGIVDCIQGLLFLFTVHLSQLSHFNRGQYRFKTSKRVQCFTCLNHDERVPAPQPRHAVGCSAGSYESHVSPPARKVNPDVQLCRFVVKIGYVMLYYGLK